MKSNQLPTIDCSTFFAHISRLKHLWETSYKKQFSSILIVNPKDEGINIRAFAMNGWLYGLNLNDSVLLVTQK